MPLLISSAVIRTAEESLIDYYRAIFVNGAHRLRSKSQLFIDKSDTND